MIATGLDARVQSERVHCADKTLDQTSTHDDVSCDADRDRCKEILWKRARRVDYSRPIENSVIEGITFFDHAANPHHPSHFHVRNDGWMGASLTFDGPREITGDKCISAAACTSTAI